MHDKYFFRYSLIESAQESENFFLYSSTSFICFIVNSLGIYHSWSIFECLYLWSVYLNICQGKYEGELREEKELVEDVKF